jgi:hypothetical protein
MKHQLKIKTLIKKICDEDAVLADHDLNVTILNENLRDQLKALIQGFDLVELNRVLGYFIDELEGDGIHMDNCKIDDPDMYLIFCINECEQTIEELHAYTEEFMTRNF